MHPCRKDTQIRIDPLADPELGLTARIVRIVNIAALVGEGFVQGESEKFFVHGLPPMD